MTTAAREWGGARRNLSDEDLYPPAPHSTVGWYGFVPGMGSSTLPTTVLVQANTHEAALWWARMQVEPLLQLPANWDSYGGLPVDGDAASTAAAILAAVVEQGVPTPAIGPTADGGLSLEWHPTGLDFVITVSPPDEEAPSAYFRNAAGEEWLIPDLFIQDQRLAVALERLRQG